MIFIPIFFANFMYMLVHAALHAGINEYSVHSEEVHVETEAETRSKGYVQAASRNV